MVDHVLQLPLDTRLMILSPLIVERKVNRLSCLMNFVHKVLSVCGLTAKSMKLTHYLSCRKLKNILLKLLLIALKVSPDAKQRLAESFEVALRHSDDAL